LLFIAELHVERAGNGLWGWAFARRMGDAFIFLFLEGFINGKFKSCKRGVGN
jgi:hypothetical protein